MCETLTELRDKVVAYAAGFDASMLAVAQAEAVVRLAPSEARRAPPAA